MAVTNTFDWFVEEEWDQHCLNHLQSITSKRCGSITHYHTLFRPAFCPFCISDNKLPASSRWTSWTREAKLWSHLESHLESSRWPLECPHPLCSLQLHDETLFLYHLSDVHSLRMSPNMKKCQPIGCNSKPLINWTPDKASHKRKRQATDGLDPRPLKRTKGPLQIKWGNKWPLNQSLNRKSPDQAQAMLSPGSFKASITQAASNDLQDLPQLTYSESMSPPDTDELQPMDDLSLNQGVLQKELHSEPKWLRDLPETHTPGQKFPLPGEDALFSQYLRSQSPSYFSAQDIGDNYNSNEGIHSPTITPTDICLGAEEDSNPAALIDQNTATPENIPVKTNKLRITLRIRQPKPEPKPKVLLRLSQPKKAPAQRSVRQGINIADHDGLRMTLCATSSDPHLPNG